MACVTCVPVGVQYDKLIERVRPQLERHGDRTWAERALRRAVLALFTHPSRLRAFVPFMALQRLLPFKVPFGNLAPKVPLRAAVQRLPEVTPAKGEQRGRSDDCDEEERLFRDVNAATGACCGGRDGASTRRATPMLRRVRSHTGWRMGEAGVRDIPTPRLDHHRQRVAGCGSR